MNKIQTQIINKCFGKYISLLLSTQQSSITLEIIQSENLTFIQQSFNESLKQVIESNLLEQLQSQISPLCIDQIQSKTINQIQQSNELNEKEKELIRLSYLHFIDICLFDEQFKQQFQRHLKNNIYSLPPSQHLLYSIFLKEYYLIIENNKLKTIFIEIIQTFLFSSPIKIIDNLPIIISISFREFFNGFTKRFKYKENNQMKYFLITRKPCERGNGKN